MGEYRGVNPLHGISCRCCGTKILQVKYSGRLPEYCSAHCRNTLKYWNAFCRELDKANLDSVKTKEWAGRLFAKRNEL